jgi:hypothetical protein
LDLALEKGLTMTNRNIKLTHFPYPRLPGLLLLIGLLALSTACRTSLGISTGMSVNVDNEHVTELGGVLDRSTVLSGKVTITEDLFIPEGVTLTLARDTRVIIEPSEGTRTDSQFVTTETEILVRGRLLTEPGVRIGTKSGVRGSWGGIIITSPEGRVELDGVYVSGAQYGVLALAGQARVYGSVLTNNEVGLAGTRGSGMVTANNTYTDNGIATAAYFTASPIISPDDLFKNNDDDALGLDTSDFPIAHRQLAPAIPDRNPVTREYLGETALSEDTTWSGTVIIDGQVAVPPDYTLTIEPGTQVLFRFRDSNGDGLGESWLIVQGTIRVLGEEDAWVLFDSEDEEAGPGSWDSLSVIASDSTDNIVRHAVFRRGVKAFHSHFSNADLKNVIFTDNLRAVQFQESSRMVIDQAYLTRNQSGMRFRDSVVRLSNIVAADNTAGINFLRCSMEASDILVSGSVAESFVSRESDTKLTRAAIVNNVRGPRFKGDGQKIEVRESVIAGNLTEGLSLNSVTASVRESALIDNGFTGLSVTDADVTAFMNRIADNGRFAVDNNGMTTVDARGNDWGTGTPPPPDIIYDDSDEAGIGEVLTGDIRRFSILLPGMEPATDNHGEVLVVGDVFSRGGRTVRLSPGSSVFFSEIPRDSLFDLCSDHPSFPGSELHVMGRLEAIGTAEDPITFAPARRTIFELDPESGPGSAQWGAINLIGGEGAVFEHCYFFRAATGIHAREAGRVVVRDSVFTSNLVGLRFSQSDMEVTGNTFELNNAGIRFHENGGLIEGNLIDANGTGIFVTANPEDVVINNNRFINQWDYNVKLGILVTKDVVIEGGVLETVGGRSQADMIFDKEDDPDLGRVIVR